MFLCLLVHVLLVFLFSSCGTCSMGLSGTLPRCQDKCGNVIIPYPFGLSDSCHLPGFDITCNHTYNPPKPFISTGNIQIFNITDETLTVNLVIAGGDGCEYGNTFTHTWTHLGGDQHPYTFSQTRNIFTAIGCNTLAYFYNGMTISGCVSDCTNMPNTNNVDGPCSGHNGCCQTYIPKYLKSYNITLSKNNETFNCSKAFLVDKEWFTFNSLYIKSFNRTKVPVVLDWAIGYQTCDVAKNFIDYACRDNTRCVNFINGKGYRCSCLDGYQGNPYLSYLHGGCQDMNECASPMTNNCITNCTNTPGSYMCSCPSGSVGDGKKNGTGCKKISKLSKLKQIVLGSGLGSLVVIVVIIVGIWLIRNRRKLREKSFQDSVAVVCHCMQFFDSSRVDQVSDRLDNASS